MAAMESGGACATTAACNPEMRQGGEAASGQPAWSGVCSGLEGDPVQEAVARAADSRGAADSGATPSPIPPPCRRRSPSPEGRGNRFQCDWCRRLVNRHLHVSGDKEAGGATVPVSAGNRCCAGVCWHEDGDWIELCCLCYHVPNPGTFLTSPWYPCCCGATSAGSNPPKCKYVHTMAASLIPWYCNTIFCINFMT